MGSLLVDAGAGQGLFNLLLDLLLFRLLLTEPLGELLRLLLGLLLRDACLGHRLFQLLLDLLCGRLTLGWLPGALAGSAELHLPLLACLPVLAVELINLLPAHFLRQLLDIVAVDARRLFPFLGRDVENDFDTGFDFTDLQRFRRNRFPFGADSQEAACRDDRVGELSVLHIQHQIFERAEAIAIGIDDSAAFEIPGAVRAKCLLLLLFLLLLAELLLPGLLLLRLCLLLIRPAWRLRLAGLLLRGGQCKSQDRDRPGDS